MSKQKLFVGVLVAVAACGKGKSAPPPYTGAVTFERIEKARSLIHLGDDWAGAIATIEAEAGPVPAKTETRATWSLTDGASCAELTIERKADHVTSIEGGKRFNKADFNGTPNNFTDCEAIAKR